MCRRASKGQLCSAKEGGREGGGSLLRSREKSKIHVEGHGQDNHKDRNSSHTTKALRSLPMNGVVSYKTIAKPALSAVVSIYTSGKVNTHQPLRE
jgi:hypothetical protein